MTVNRLSVMVNRAENTKKDQQIQKRVLLKNVVGVILALSFYSMFCFLYFGTGWDTISRTNHLSFGLVNNDVGINVTTPNGPVHINIGRSLSLNFASLKGIGTADPNNPLFDFHVYDLKITLQEARNKVEEGELWTALVFPSNFTQVLLSSISPLRNASSSAKYSNPVPYFYDQGRQSNAISLINAIAVPAFATVNRRLSLSILNGTFGPVSTSTADLLALSSPFVTQDVNLHAISRSGLGLASYVSVMLIWLGSLFCVSILTTNAITVEHLYKPGALVVVRTLVLLAFSFLVSMSSTLILLTLGATFSVSAGAYLAFGWLLSFTFMMIINTLIAALGPVGLTLVTFFLVLQFTTSEAIFPHELSNNFFKIGYAFPFKYGISGMRWIFFGSINQIGRDIGVIVAWMVVFLLLGSLATYKGIKKRFEKREKQLQKERNGEKNESLEMEEKEKEAYGPSSDPLSNLGFSNQGIAADELADLAINSVLGKSQKNEETREDNPV
eukprot:TRINITY_DN7131_c0_g1_i3.p1 TRINITY_DN7131_c0_g1~~TRINITY_DN7131_c0_g1_i3.p1  ORF type:complete len:500 (-),score=128.51 TRINITY_DN7131_c0_g1_i3:218-1717(-)